jgi:hypothetical protein
MKNIDLQIGDTVRLKNLSSQGGYRVWLVTGNYLGALGQEDIVEFRAMDKSDNGEIRVPRAMLWALDGLENINRKPECGKAQAV